MHFYAITGVGFYATQALCHAAAREVTSPDPEIVEIDIPTDKDTLLKLLNGEAMPFELIRSFEITSRGGMVEISEEQKAQRDVRRAERGERKLDDRSPFDIWNEVFGGTLTRPEDRKTHADEEEPAAQVVAESATEDVDGAATPTL